MAPVNGEEPKIVKQPPTPRYIHTSQYRQKKFTCQICEAHNRSVGPHAFADKVLMLCRYCHKVAVKLVEAKEMQMWRGETV